MKGHAITGFNHGVLGLAELGPGFIHQNTSGDALSVFDSESQSLPSKHCDVGPTLAQRLPNGTPTLDQRGFVNWPNVGPTLECQRWPNDAPTSARRWHTNVGPTLAQRHANGCMPTLYQHWANGLFDYGM